MITSYRVEAANKMESEKAVHFQGREARVHKMPPSPDRWKERSRTYEGIAAAMAAQWGNCG